MALIKLNKIVLGFVGVTLAATAWVSHGKPYHYPIAEETLFFQSGDTTALDSLDSIKNAPYTPTRKPVFTPKDRFGDPFSNTSSSSPLLLKDPSSLSLDVEIDTGMNYTIYEKIGDLNYRPTSSMSFEEFRQYQDRKLVKEYWKNRSAGLDGESAVSGRNLIPPIYISPIFDRIFGGSYVEIIPRGFVTLDFGARWQRVNRPDIPIRQQRNGGFEFDMQTSMNVVGKIGEKLSVTANFDNNNSFDFENNLKVEFTGFEEDILQKLEIGNVSLPLNNSLISGAQNLFGVKAQMQFGKLYVTSVMSTQRGKSESIEIDGGGGGQGTEFKLRASEYDENQHFFIGQYFRDNYERWMQQTPILNAEGTALPTEINITRLEVYRVNTTGNTQGLRNVIGLIDLGEGQEKHIYNSSLVTGTGAAPTANESNNLFNLVSGISDMDINGALESLKAAGFKEGTDFERISSARKLDPSEYSFNPKLGYLSVYSKVQPLEAIAIAFEYTNLKDGKTYKVGEMPEDYSARDDNKVIIMKLLKPKSVNTEIPTWDLMMKNIYNLSSGQIEREGFQLRVIYQNDQTGNDETALTEGSKTQNVQLVELFGLDRFNPNLDRPADGNFDFLEGVTIDSKRGFIIFPKLEPFGATLAAQFEGDPNEETLKERYVYSQLYEKQKDLAELDVVRNKYAIVGRAVGGSASEILLRGLNVAEGSVKVMAGGAPLTEGTDYQVDYNFGKVTILNQSVLNSGQKISITYETADLFNFQTRSLLGTRFDYKYSKDINFGATLLYLNERPLITRNNIGNEPARNLKYGFDVNIRKESRLLTKMVDALPLLQTKAPSTINFSAEVAQLRPGSSNKVQGENTSYIDDFESTVTPFNLNNWQNWHLASTPRTRSGRFVDKSDTLGVGYKRAKLAWYQVDNVFYRNGGSNLPELPSGGDIGGEVTENYFERPIAPQEIFRGRQQNVINTNEPILDLAYFPDEPGPYNYAPRDTDGSLSGDPRNNWAGVTNAIRTTIDFNSANIEYIEFWMMDPFTPDGSGEGRNLVRGVPNPQPVDPSGGELYFNLGNVSEDLIPDSRHGFENGLPPDGVDTFVSGDGRTASLVDTTAWGRITRQNFQIDAFDDSEGARANQDVGMDGLSNAQESAWFVGRQGIPGLNPGDPSGDDFRYFLGDEFDAAKADIITRYKNFNGQDGNSPLASGTTARSNSNRPDNEDLNQDRDISDRDTENYYEYRIRIREGEMEVGKNYIVDKVTSSVNNVNWYLYRIPILQFSSQFGNVGNFNTIKFLRTYLTGFSSPVVLRFANFRFVGSQWRRSSKNLKEGGVGRPTEEETKNLSISVVNIEDNGQGNERQPRYVLPPGIIRDRDNTSTIERRLNEQSLQLCVDKLEDGDARAAFKRAQFDLINYKRIKMFFHANSTDIPAGNRGEVTAFLRLGKDDEENYYEIEVPLRISSPNDSDPEAIWPSENEIDLDFDQLILLKNERQRDNAPENQLYPINGPKQIGNHRIRVIGRPELNDMRQLMIGIRNPRATNARPGDSGEPLSVCIWANEMRVTAFDQTPGWAANASLNTQLADFANITASARYTSFGFGGIQSKIAERTREETASYDMAATVNLDKLLPGKSGIKVPMYVNYGETVVTPEYDPGNSDVRLESSLLGLREEDREDYKKIAQDRTVRRGINFTNVRKEKTKEDAKRHLYDIENFSFTYAYNELTQRNFNRALYQRLNYRGSVDYNFSTRKEPWEPFREGRAFNSPYLKLIKEFNLNPLPNSLTVRGDLDRQFTKTLYRNVRFEEGRLRSEEINPAFEKYFTFNRTYGLRWDLTRSLSLDYNAVANAIIDEPEGDINSEVKRDSIWSNLKRLGRMKRYDQDVSVNYRLPFDKIPFTDWLNTELRYAVGYTWTAGSITQSDTLDFGNNIQNSRDRSLSSKIDMVKLYNKVKFLKEINQPPRRRGSRRTSSPDSTASPQKDLKLAKGFFRLLMSLRSVNATYTLNEGTLLPGFRPDAYLLGMDKGFEAPGVPFLLGDQDPGIRKEAASNDWLVRNQNLNTPFSQSRNIDLSVRANLEPFKDLKIQLDVKKRKTAQFQEVFKYDSLSNGFRSQNPFRSGSYSVSIITLKTAFKGIDDKNNSTVFTDFENHRGIIRDRLGRKTGAIYDSSAQDVLIPAFIAAYTGKDPSEISLSPFPKIPVPNWRLDYAGLGKLPSLKEKFSSINITHGYSSNYTVSNYASSAQFDEGLGFENNIEDYNESVYTLPNVSGEVIPLYNIDQVQISEQFSPLIGINLRTKSRVNIKVEYKTQRNLSLQISNRQVTDVKNRDISLDVGFTKANVKLPFKSKGRVITLKNDLQFRMNMTLRNNITIQRKINDLSTVTNGTVDFRLRPNFNYVLNKRLNLQFYFERSVIDPRISSSNKRSTTAFGTQVRFSLAQ